MGAPHLAGVGEPADLLLEQGLSKKRELAGTRTLGSGVVVLTLTNPGSTDLTGLVTRLVVPDGRVVPRSLASDMVHAHAITRDDLDDDVAGINASLDLIRRTRGGTWPTEPVTHEGNYVDLVWHECEFRDERSFTYVLTTARHGL